MIGWAAGTVASMAAGQIAVALGCFCCQGRGATRCSSPGASGMPAPRAAAAWCLHPPIRIRDDGWTPVRLCSAPNERDLFRLLVAVSGVGPPDGPGPCSGHAHEELVRAIVQADLRLLSTAPAWAQTATAELLSVEPAQQAVEAFRSRAPAALEANQDAPGAGRSSAKTPGPSHRDDVRSPWRPWYEPLEIQPGAAGRGASRGWEPTLGETPAEGGVWSGWRAGGLEGSRGG